MSHFIAVRGAEEHNLKKINIDVPKNKLVVFTGVSGSGKSSLVFDTIYAEAFRRFVDASQAPIYVLGNSVWSKISRPRFLSITGLPPALGLSQRQGVASKTSTVGTICGMSDLLRVYFASFGDVFCRHCQIPLRAQDVNQIIQIVFDRYLNKKVFFIANIAEKRKGSFAKEIQKFRELGFSKIRVNESTFDLQDESKKIKVDGKKLNTIDIIVDFTIVNQDKKQRIERAVAQALDYGKGLIKIESDGVQTKCNTKSFCPQCGESAPKLDPRHFSHSSLGQCTACSGTGSQKDHLPADLFPCPACHGMRLSQDKPIVRVCGKNFEEIHSMCMDDLKFFISEELSIDAEKDKAKSKVHGELLRQIKAICQLNLSHLNLNRGGMTLSPGDLQRLRFAAMIANSLQGVLYVCDEPCQGLTIEEVGKLVAVFRTLVNAGSSALCVEHHPTFLQEADVEIVIGPGAGIHGGHVVSFSSANEKSRLNKNMEASIKHPIEKKEKGLTYLEFKNISVRNLARKSLSLQQQGINILRGQAGSGKSSFVEMCLLPILKSLGGKNIEEEEDLGSSPFAWESFCQISPSQDIKVSNYSYVKPNSIVRNSRRIVAAALDVVQSIRKIYGKLPTSQLMGLSESHFSWSSKLGCCSQCEGRGYIELPQKYAQPVRMTCELCLGARLNSRSLVPRFKGYNIADLMQISLEQVLSVFENQRVIVSKIQKAVSFGLGYIQLGQGMDSLSGGELQRLNLTLQLKRSSLAGSWFVLYHPSTGLHEPDIKILGTLMGVMVDKGATFVAIENREEFLPFAHHVVSF